MVRGSSSTGKRRTRNGEKTLQVASVDEKQVEVVAGTSGGVDGEEMEQAETGVEQEELDEEPEDMEGGGQQDNDEVPQRTKGNSNLRVKLPTSFTPGIMSEEYHALCAVKNAASQAEQKVLGCVAERAMSWLRLAYKKIHDKDLPRQACCVEESQVMETLEAITELDPSATATKKKVKKNGTGQDKEQPSSEDVQEIRRSKRLAQAAAVDEPPSKKQGVTDDSDDDDDIVDNYENDDDCENNDSSSEAEAASDISSPSKEAAGIGWKNIYKQPSQPNTRMAYLAEFYKRLQTIDLGLCTAIEALEHTRHIHKLMDGIDASTCTSCSTTINCLLVDSKTIWEWADTRIGTTMAGRTVQKYLLSLEKFYLLITCCELPPHLPKLSHASLVMARCARTSLPGFRTTAGKIAAERRWKSMKDNPEYMHQLHEENVRRHKHILDPNIIGLRNSTPMGTQPLRSKWDRKDEQLLVRYFTFKPPKDVIRHVCEEVEELRELVAKKDLNVATKRSKLFIGETLQYSILVCFNLLHKYK
ncbi:hypothetical protein OS493_003644 [Desmophyllum pertusum]|uniref:Uncharacterized protein n=1 Tax=Desmophyllum pertusum TaxID=174260 RepID=A0A9X0DCR2_9CNID|nr:hypothetical protein OS493_003644 [Desmophyllum pertusum]